MDLSRLKPMNVRCYAEKRAGGPVPGDILDLLYRRCNGNPLFMQESVRFLMEVADRQGLDSIRARRQISRALQ